MPLTLCLLLWLFSALATVLAYACVSICFDRSFVVSTWIKLWLVLMVVTGPLGTVLTLRTLWLIIGDVRREVRRQQLPGYPRDPQGASTSHSPATYAPAHLPSLAGSSR